MKILVVEGPARPAAGVARRSANRDTQIDVVHGLAQAMSRLLKGRYGAVLLEADLPETAGKVLLPMLRARGAGAVVAQTQGPAVFCRGASVRVMRLGRPQGPSLSVADLGTTLAYALGRRTGAANCPEKPGSAVAPWSWRGTSGLQGRGAGQTKQDM